MDRQELRAFIFDMDGVVTDTAETHFAAWKEVFDAFLAGRGTGAAPFTRTDYLRHVDGVPRFEGVRRFLAARGIALPDGAPEAMDAASIHGLGNLKNRRFGELLRAGTVRAHDDACALIRALPQAGMKVGIFSASRNAPAVLAAAGVERLFDAVVDGQDAERLGFAGKPDPAMLLEAASRLGCPPDATAVVEDAVAGVEAGARGRFALVVGVNRQTEQAAGQRHALRAAGADLVVRDLRRLLAEDGAALRRVDTLPGAWARREELAQRIAGRGLAVFLDYDGTLTPIVSDYRRADIAGETVAAIAALARRCPVAIVSGRDLADLRGRVGLEGLYYAGSHGIDIAGPGGLRDRPEQAEDFLPAIRAAGEALARAVAAIPGAEVEAKTFSIAVHYRNVAEADLPRVEAVLDSVLARHPELHRRRGKKVYELQPRIAWDKGRAVEWLLERTPLGAGDRLPLYVGDDLTDEDAFAALAGSGIALVVRGGDRLTLADYALEDVAEVRRLLLWLTEREGEDA